MKLWGGRFKEKTDPLMERFSASINFDWVLYEEDIEEALPMQKCLKKLVFSRRRKKNPL